MGTEVLRVPVVMMPRSKEAIHESARRLRFSSMYKNGARSPQKIQKRKPSTLGKPESLKPLKRCKTPKPSWLRTPARPTLSLSPTPSTIRPSLPPIPTCQQSQNASKPNRAIAPTRGHISSSERNKPQSAVLPTTSCPCCSVPLKKFWLSEAVCIFMCPRFNECKFPLDQINMNDYIRPATSGSTQKCPPNAPVQNITLSPFSTSQSASQSEKVAGVLSGLSDASMSLLPEPPSHADLESKSQVQDPNMAFTKLPPIEDGNLMDLSIPDCPDLNIIESGPFASSINSECDSIKKCANSSLVALSDDTTNVTAPMSGATTSGIDMKDDTDFSKYLEDLLALGN